MAGASGSGAARACSGGGSTAGENDCVVAGEASSATGASTGAFSSSSGTSDITIVY